MPPFRTRGRCKERFVILEVKGCCLGREVPEGSIFIADTRAVIRFGDIVAMEGLDGIERGAKIFLGRVNDTIEVVMLNPVGTFRAKLRELNYAHRVRAITRWRWMVPIIIGCIRLRIPHYERKMGLVAATAEGKEIRCLKR